MGMKIVARGGDNKKVGLKFFFSDYYSLLWRFGIIGMCISQDISCVKKKA